MNRKYFVLALFSVLLVPAVSVFAAGVVLTNGGLGQSAGNTTSFSVAVCNAGKKGLSQSVPVMVAGGNGSVTISSAASIAPGACEYSSVNYADLGMSAGQSYNVTVTIDPNLTVISNKTNQASYTVTVPGSAPATASAPSQPNNTFMASIGGFFKALFRMK